MVEVLQREIARGDYTEQTYIDFVVADLGLTRRKLTRRKRDLADQK